MPGKIVRYVGKATSIEDFGKFAEVLIQAVPARQRYQRKPWLLLDSKYTALQIHFVPLIHFYMRCFVDALAHYNRPVLKKLGKHFNVQFIPRYVSELVTYSVKSFQVGPTVPVLYNCCI